MLKNRPNHGFTLVEMLVVILILSVLASFLFPVFAMAKESARKSDCLSRLHQASIALSLYVEDTGDYPAWRLPAIGSNPGGKLLRSTSALGPYLSKSKSTLVCPLDRGSGRVQAPDDRSIPRSFAQTWFLWEGSEGKEAWDALLASDPNPIVFRCHFHEPRVKAFLLKPEANNYFGALEHGSALTVRRDGSVSVDKRPNYFPRSGPSPEDIKQTLWALATNVPCPKSVCDGKEPKEGFREP